MAPKNVACWFEIPVSDLKRSMAFYNAVLKTDLQYNEDGPNPVAVFPYDGDGVVAGHLYPGKPAAKGAGNTIHLTVPDTLEESMKRVSENGGEVVSPIITIAVGRFAYCTDPDGNSIGLFGR